MPMWFWNDELTEAELRRQIGEFHAKGLGGFILHPRTGLSRRIGYLTPEFFRLVKAAVTEAARLGLKVILYDEAGYPAGSARGRVVAQNPDWAAKCIFPLSHPVHGPARGFWRPNPGRALTQRLVSVTAARERADGTLDPDSWCGLAWDEHELVAYDLPAGDWLIVAVWEGHSGGTTRGAFAEEEDGHALAPPAADLLREDAMAFFIRCTYDAYYAHLQEHFGTTILAMFTDEPTPTGRINDERWRERIRPWTPGFLTHLQSWWPEDVKGWLPALWWDCGPRTTKFRTAFRSAVQARLTETFYDPISRWCRDHGVALTGHAAHSDEMSNLRTFQWPGQDIVWRMIEPGKPTALEGPDSVTAKAASSAARLGARRFNVVEVFGAYGWRLNFDEIKWLLDWHFVRGTNLIFPHAAFYSIRGRRTFESEPDVALHNGWWPHFGLLGDYGRRMCWLFSDGEQVCAVGVLSDGDHLSWRAAAVLHRHQQDFIFIDDRGLAEARVEGNRLVAGTQALRVIIVDAPGHASPAAVARLKEFRAAGGVVLPTWTETDLPGKVVAAVGREVEWVGPPARDLRVLHYRKGDLDFHLLSNEGETELAGEVKLQMEGRVEVWDALTGSTMPYPAKVVTNGGMRVSVCLPRRETLILAVDPASSPYTAAVAPMRPGATVAALEGPWMVADPEGRAVDAPGLGDWAKAKGWETFSGTLSYATSFALGDGPRPRFLDLGQVGDIAEVHLNGIPLGVRGWAPYLLDLGEAIRTGANQLEVKVTNSMANAYDGLQLPSGLIGPVVLRTGD